MPQPHPDAIDLRSDTVTRPTPEMLEAMARAPLGDDGLDGDPTVRALEDAAAERLGKAAGLFVVSGTMGNLVAVLAHGRLPGEVLAEAGSHLVNAERAAAGLTGMHYRALPGDGGLIALPALEAALDTDVSARCPTAMVAVENTHNALGGSVAAPAALAALHALAVARGVPVHTDGARLFNAAVALGLPCRRLAEHTDSVTVCLSKGLSAPVGSVLAGSRDFIARARGIRRMLGGTLRQAGVLAAAGLVALEHMVERLAEDHARARALHAGLRAIDAGWCASEPPQTNIVQLRVGTTAADARQWEQRLAAAGVLVRTGGAGLLRLVTHRHIDDDAVARALQVFGALRREE
ncbi:MAG: aminotransferase class I/II-fold pyridoxal phosphate-dependent enzyme [Comamonadaceae bacterium]|nr:aminotransferase class I/II-fold pyridoxal phosphate-dependent enzyme [Comamonadaceae bacterium]